MLTLGPEQRGLGLVEFLVALLVASLGLLGWVALQTMSQRYAQITHRRVVADLLAQDLVERMRANTVDATDLAHYEFTETFAQQAAVSPGQFPGAPTCSAQSDICSVASLAAADLLEVRARIQQLLPPDGALFSQRADSSVDASQRTLQVWVAWREPVWRDDQWALRSPDECPSGLATEGSTIRCLRWQVRR